MARERHLVERVEDPHPRRPALLRGQHEGRLGESDLEGERLHRRVVEAAGVGEDRELVSGERRVGEDVRDDVAVGGHAWVIAGAFPCGAGQGGPTILGPRARLSVSTREGGAGRAGRGARAHREGQAAGRRARRAAREPAGAAGRRALEPARARAADRRADRVGDQRAARDRAAARTGCDRRGSPGRRRRPGRAGRDRRAPARLLRDRLRGDRSRPGLLARARWPSSTSSSRRDVRPGDPGQRPAQVLRRRRGRARDRLRGRGRARYSACSGRTAPARRRRSRSSRATASATAATSACSAVDPWQADAALPRADRRRAPAVASCRRR